MVESSGHRSTTAPAAAGFFRVPGLFVRLSSKGGGVGKSNAVDPDSVWSPTSPLDLKHLRSSPPRVCLGLADALAADEAGSLHFGGRSSFLGSIKPFLDLHKLATTSPKPSGFLMPLLAVSLVMAQTEDFNPPLSCHCGFITSLNTNSIKFSIQQPPIQGF